MNNSTHTLCFSRHLTSFAILVSVTGEVSVLRLFLLLPHIPSFPSLPLPLFENTHKIDVPGLNILSYIGCAMSIISLIATITILLVLR